MMFYGPIEDLFLGKESDSAQPDYIRIANDRIIEGNPVMLRLSSAPRNEESKKTDGGHTYRRSFIQYKKPGGNRFTIMATIDNKGELHVRNSFAVKGPGPVTSLDENSPYAIVFFDSHGKVLSKDPIPYKSFRIAHDKRPIPSGDKPPYHLTSIRPLPDGTVAVEIQKDGVMLHRIQPKARRPIVSMVKTKQTKIRDKSVLKINWTAHDPDGDMLRYFIEYSRDGGKTFVPILTSTEKTELHLDPYGLPGGKRALIRVTASDGINRGSAVSNPFIVPEHAPHVAITSLRDGDRFKQNDVIHLRGLAYDMEEGLLEKGPNKNKRFTWLLDEKIVIGNGSRLILHRKLSPGRHKITFKATDLTGRTSTDTVVIVIEPKADKPLGLDLLRELAPQKDLPMFIKEDKTYIR